MESSDVNDNNWLFIQHFCKVCGNNENKITIGLNKTPKQIFLIKNNKIINNVMDYVKRNDHIKDFAEDYYHLLLLALNYQNMDWRFTNTFYLQHKKHICQSIKKICCKNNKRPYDLFILKEYDEFVNHLFDY